GHVPIAYRYVLDEQMRRPFRDPAQLQRDAAALQVGAVTEVVADPTGDTSGFGGVVGENPFPRRAGCQGRERKSVPMSSTTPHRRVQGFRFGGVDDGHLRTVTGHQGGLRDVPGEAVYVTCGAVDRIDQPVTLATLASQGRRVLLADHGCSWVDRGQPLTQSTVGHGIGAGLELAPLPDATAHFCVGAPSSEQITDLDGRCGHRPDESLVFVHAIHHARTGKLGAFPFGSGTDRPSGDGAARGEGPGESPWEVNWSSLMNSSVHRRTIVTPSRHRSCSRGAPSVA